jgi:RNA polymerase sigma-70 factor (ECF subfamily)
VARRAGFVERERASVKFPTDRQRYSADQDPPGPPTSAVPESELTARFWDRVRLFASRRVSDAAMAEDIAQETMRRVIEALRSGRVQNTGAIAGFVFQTAKHVCMHAHRSAGREARAMRRLHDPSDPEGAHPDPLARLVSEERRVRVRSALQTLSPDDRDLLRAVYFEQVDTTALARRLGLSPGALRVRKHRAMQRLAAALGSGQPDETLSAQRELNE